MVVSFNHQIKSLCAKAYPAVRERSARAYRVSKERYRKLSGSRYFHPILYGLLFLVAILHGWALLHARLGAHFTQDSYAYYLLGKNVFGGLGYTSYCARDFSVEPVWPVLSQSFPPLHPILTGLVDVITDLGVRSLSVVSLFYLMGTIVTMFFLGRGLDKKSWLFLFFAFIAVIGTNPFYREELEAGRSIPGMMLFYLLAMGCFVRTLDGKVRSRRTEILCGVMLAAMLLQRFDQTLFTLAFLFCSFFIFKLRGLNTRQSLIRTGTIAGAFAVASFPWALRNIIHFGSPFASDNTGSTMSTFRGLYCCHFWLPGMEPPSLFTHPEMWLNQRLKFLSSNFDKIVNITHHLVYVVPVAVLAMWRTFSFRQWVFIFFVLIQFCTTLFTISLTPYGDNRYFSLVHLNLAVVVAMVIANAFHAGSTRVIRAVVQTAMVLYLLHTTFSNANVRRFEADLLAGKIIPQTPDAKIANHRRMEAIVSKYVKQDDVLSVKPNADGYTAFTGRRTVYWPSTIKTNRRGLAEWIEVWSVDYFLLPRKYVKRLRLDPFVVAPVGSRLLVDANAYLRSIGKSAR